MAIMTYELDETYATISRPVAMSIIRQLSQNLKITKDIPIVFPGAGDKVDTWGGGVQYSKDAANFHQQEKILVQVKEDYHEDDIMTMKGRHHYNPIIFNDTSTGIEISPNYTRQKVTISFTYRTATRYQAESFRDNWRAAVANNREHMVFFAEYKYPIPKTIEQILYLLFLKRRTYRKDYKTYQEYLFGVGSSRLTVMTNAIGKEDILAVEEVQQNIIGNFTDPIPSEAEKDDRGSVWQVSFEYEFHYDKVISTTIRYPISIDNQLVDPELYPEVPYDLNYLRSQFMTTQRWNYDNIMSEMGYLNHIRGAYIRIPEFDDWSVDLEWRKYQPLVSALILVDPEVPRDICNLTDLGDWGLHPALVPYFKQYHDCLTRIYEFPFYISLYTGNVEDVHDGIYVDHHLNILTKNDMSVFKQYHLVIHGLKDIKMLTKEGQRRFFSNPFLVNTWLDLVLGYQPPGGYPKVNNGGWVDIADFDRIIKENRITGNTDDRNYAYINPGKLLATVGIFTVVAHRQEEL